MRQKRLNRKEFIQNYKGSELDPVWLERVSKFKSRGWESFAENFGDKIDKGIEKFIDKGIDFISDSIDLNKNGEVDWNDNPNCKLSKESLNHFEKGFLKNHFLQEHLNHYDNHQNQKFF